MKGLSSEATPIRDPKLVSIYKIKSSLPGLKAAIKFFVGLPAEVANFYGMGAKMGDLGGGEVTGTYFGAGPGDHGTFILGAGDAWSLTAKCGTPGGVALTADQLARVTEIINKFKPAIAHIIQIAASFVAPIRADIKDNGSGSVTITCAAVAGATSFQTFVRAQTEVNEWNGAKLALTGTGPAALTYTPSGIPLYWVACVNNTVTNIPGLITNELTNCLTAPAVAVRKHARSNSHGQSSPGRPHTASTRA